jgi:hypothetical protein
MCMKQNLISIERLSKLWVNLSMKSSLKKSILIVLISFISFFILFFIFRNPLLHLGIKKATVILENRTGSRLEIKHSSCYGISSVELKDILLIPQGGDTLLKADTLNISFSFWSLLTGTIRLNEIYCSGLFGIVSCRDSICNYSGFIHNKNNVTGKTGESDYSLTLKRLLDKAFNLAPQKADIHNVSLVYRNDTLERMIYINEFHSDEDSVKGFAIDKINKTTWELEGSFSQDNHELHLNIFPLSGKRKLLPLTTELTGLSLGFDSLRVSLNGYSLSGNVLKTKSDFSVDNFKIYHKKISEDTVKISHASININFNAGRTFLEIDSSSIYNI